MRALCLYGDPVLRKKCTPIEAITDEIRALAHEMVKVSDQNNGIGLSACQIGVAIRLFVLRNYVPHTDGTLTVSAPLFFINPEVTLLGDAQESDSEGCLSIPGIREWVDRPIHFSIQALDLDGKPFVEVFEGKTELERLNSRVRLHENDHLNGVLFIDRLPQKVRKGLDSKLRQIKSKHTPAT